MEHEILANFKPNEIYSSARIARFILQVEWFKELAYKNEININAKQSPGAIQEFAQMSAEKQNKILFNFDSYLSHLRRAGAQRIQMNESRKLTWACLSHLNLRPCHDVFDKIKEDEVIEIYNRDHIQIFRNLRFFELCSYSVYDILVFDWPTLYYRNAKILEKVFEQTQKSFNSGSSTKSYENIPIHELTERFSDEKRSFSIEMGVHSPLFRTDREGGAPDAVLLSLKAKRIL
ncbi:MAG: hypothetical protein JWQ35_225 [Bacteriovoracaceae bacterium]|nr:hypothetical protein [Bacteriovoracaceae bacterium]